MAGRFGSRALGVVALAALTFSVLGARTAQAGDVVTLPVTGVMQSADARQKLDGSVAFYFGNSAHPKVLQKMGEFVSNKKTNGFGKADAESCNRAMLSALITFQSKAQSLGGNAVINIRSYYGKKEVSYDDQFECHSGFLMAGVTLKGDVVKLKRC